MCSLSVILDRVEVSGRVRVRVKARRKLPVWKKKEKEREGKAASVTLPPSFIRQR